MAIHNLLEIINDKSIVWYKLYTWYQSDTNEFINVSIKKIKDDEYSLSRPFLNFLNKESLRVTTYNGNIVLVDDNRNININITNSLLLFPYDGKYKDVFDKHIYSKTISRIIKTNINTPIFSITNSNYYMNYINNYNITNNLENHLNKTIYCYRPTLNKLTEAIISEEQNAKIIKLFNSNSFSMTLISTVLHNYTINIDCEILQLNHIKNAIYFEKSPLISEDKLVKYLSEIYSNNVKTIIDFKNKTIVKLLDAYNLNDKMYDVEEAIIAISKHLFGNNMFDVARKKSIQINETDNDIIRDSIKLITPYSSNMISATSNLLDEEANIRYDTDFKKMINNINAITKLNLYNIFQTDEFSLLFYNTNKWRILNCCKNKSIKDSDNLRIFTISNNINSGMLKFVKDKNQIEIILNDVNYLIGEEYFLLLLPLVKNIENTKYKKFIDIVFIPNIPIIRNNIILRDDLIINLFSKTNKLNEKITYLKDSSVTNMSLVYKKENKGLIFEDKNSIYPIDFYTYKILMEDDNYVEKKSLLEYSYNGNIDTEIRLSIEQEDNF
jgi:uncharacterized protein YaeQ